MEQFNSIHKILDKQHALLNELDRSTKLMTAWPEAFAKGLTCKAKYVVRDREVLKCWIERSDGAIKYVHPNEYQTFASIPNEFFVDQAVAFYEQKGFEIAAIPLYQKEFGTGFELGIVVPEYFKDVSYHNDTCPSFHYWKGNRGLRLLVDWKDRNQREEPHYTRYNLSLIQGQEDDFIVLENWFDSESAEETQKYIDNLDDLNGLLETF